jgi:hypothetical protein
VFERACCEGCLELVKLLVANNIKPTDCALQIAIDRGHFEIVQFLLRVGANIHESLLQDTISRKRWDIVEWLVRCGADITPKMLNHAPFYERPDVAHLLLECASVATLQQVHSQVESAKSWAMAELTRRLLVLALNYQTDQIVHNLVKQGVNVTECSLQTMSVDMSNFSEKVFKGKSVSVEEIQHALKHVFKIDAETGFDDFLSNMNWQLCVDIARQTQMRKKKQCFLDKKCKKESRKKKNCHSRKWEKRKRAKCRKEKLECT